MLVDLQRNHVAEDVVPANRHSGRNVTDCFVCAEVSDIAGDTVDIVKTIPKIPGRFSAQPQEFEWPWLQEFVPNPISLLFGVHATIVHSKDKLCLIPSVQLAIGATILMNEEAILNLPITILPEIALLAAIKLMFAFLSSRPADLIVSPNRRNHSTILNRINQFWHLPHLLFEISSG